MSTQQVPRYKFMDINATIEEPSEHTNLHATWWQWWKKCS